MYTFDSKVRYSETDEMGLLSPVSIINYLQDCSTFQSEELGVGVEWLKRKRRGWFLNSWRILTDRRPALCEPIRIGTAAYGFKGIYGYRHFFIQDQKGEFLVRADSIWFLCDTESNRPVKPGEEFTSPYLGMEDPELHMGETKRKILLPEKMELVGSQTVQKHHLDTNHHVNNAQYIAIGMEACGLLAPQEMQAEYRRAAVLRDGLFIYAGRDAEGFLIVNLANEEKEPYAVLRFSRS